MTVSHIEMIPLRQLNQSEHNARKTAASAADEDQLEASIAVHGVRQNLQVLLSGSPNADDAYEVVAGGRRLRALMRLAEAGKIDRDTYTVPCLVMDEGAEEVAEISLVENVVRADMHPADQVEAFRELHEGGHSVEEIAARFGVTPVTVEKRLRLATVHPDLLQAYRDEELTLEALTAFTVSADPEAQLTCFKAVEGHYHVNPRSIRSTLLDDKLNGGSAAAQFVGIAEYEAAGGTVTRDLFAAEDEAGVYIDDPQLLKTLATSKLNEVAAALKKEGWKWADVLLEYDYTALAGYGRFHAPEPEPTPEEAAKLEAIEEKMGTLHEAYDDNEDDGGDEWDEDEYDRLERQHNEITGAVEQRTAFTPEQMAASGVCIYLANGGTVRSEYGLIRPDDAAAAQAVVETGSNGHAGNGTVKPRTKAPAASNPEAEARKDAGVSQALADDLKHIRTSMVKAELAQRPLVAVDLLVFQLGRQMLGGDNLGYGRKALEFSATVTATHPVDRYQDAGFAENNPGEARFQEIAEELKKRHEPWLGTDPERTVGQCWQAFCEISENDKQDMLAFCVAAMVTNQLSIETGRAGELEAAVERLGPPLDDARLSADVFWNRIPKKAILQAMAEAGDSEWADGFKSYKKKELAEHAEAIFRNPDGEVTLSENAKDRIRKWTPPGFAAQPASVEE